MAKLVFRIQADYEEVIKLRNEIDKLKRELKSMDATRTPTAFNALNTQLSISTQRMDELVTEAAKAGAAMESDFKRKIFDASQAVNGFTEKIIAQKAVVKDVESDVKRLGEAYRDAVKKNRYGNNDDALNEWKAAKKALDEEKAALFGLTQEQAKARLSVKALRDEYALMKGDSKDVSQSVDDIKDAFIGISKNALGTIGIGVGIKEFVGQMVKVRSEFQAADTAIQTLLGSKEKADELMAKVREYAKISPLEFSDVTSATQMMLGFNIEAEKVPKFLAAIGDVSMGETGKFNSLTLAFSQMSAAGKLMGQDLNQMINAGFNPLQQIAETTGKSISQLKDEMSKGAISAEMVQQAFIDATSAGGKFYNMSENASKTITGQLSMMQDAIDMAFNEMGQASEGIIMTGIKATTTLVENYQTIGNIIEGLVVTYGVYKAAVIANIAVEKIQAINRLANIQGITLTKLAMNGLKNSIKALNLSMLATPWGIAAAAVVGLTYGIYKYATAADAADAAQKSFNDSLESMAQKAQQRQEKIEKLVNTIRSATSTSLQKQLAYDELKMLAPTITDAYESMEKLASVDMSDITKSVNEIADKDKINTLKSNIADLQKIILEYKNKIDNTGRDGKIVLAQKLMSQLKDAGIEGSWAMNANDWIDAAEGKISLLNGELQKIADAKKALEVPTKIDVELSKTAYEESKAKLDYLSDFAVAMKNEIEGNPITVPFDSGKSARDTDAIISEIQDKIDALKKEQENNPIQFTADKSKALHEYEDMLEQLKSWKAQAIKSNVFTIPIKLNLQMSSLKANTDKLQKSFNFLTGKWEASGKEKTFADDYNAAENAYKEAKKKVNIINRNKNKYTKKDYENATKTLKTTKEAFSKLGGTPTTDKQDATATNKRKQAAEKRVAAQLKSAEKTLALQRKNQQDEIALMEDGREKKLAQIEQEYKERIDAIEKQEKELVKTNKKAGLKGLNENGLTKKQQKEINKAKELYDEKRKKAESDIARSEIEEMRDYLKEYGTFQQQKLAIAEEYAEKIRKAQSEGERLSLEKQRDSALLGIDAKAAQQNIDWQSVFGDLGLILKEQIQPTIDNLKEITKSDEFKNSSIEDQQKIYDILSKLEKQSGILGKDMFKDVARDLEQYRSRLNAYNKAQQREIEATDALVKAKENLKKSQENGGDVVTAQEAVNEAQEALDSASENVRTLGNQASESAETLKASSTKARGALEGLSNGLNKLKSGSLAQAFDGIKDIGQAIGDKIGDAIANIDPTGIISGVLSILDILKEGFSSIFVSLQDTLFGVVEGILNDVLSGGIIVKPIQNALSHAGNILNTLSFGGFNSLFRIEGNAKRVEETIDRLTDRNAMLQTAIEDLTGEIKASKGTKSVKAYREAYKYQQETNDNYKAMAQAQAGYHSSHHSWNYYWGGFSQAQIDKLSSQIGRSWNGDIWNLSPEEMKLLRSNVDMWAQIQNTGKGGYGYSVSAKLNDYINQAGKLEELTNQLYEGLTGISFDSMYDSFISNLMDMKYEAKDAAEDISEYFMKAMLSNKIGEMYSDKLKEWWGKFGEAMKDNELSEQERTALADEYMGYVDEAIKLRDSLAAVTGYDSNKESSQQGGTSRTFEGASQDQMDEANGRLTALQVYQEQELGILTAQAGKFDLLSARLDTVIATGNGIRDISSEIRDMIANSYLELKQISENTGAIIKPIQQMQVDIAEVKRNTSRL